jgi:hypothetical protein
VHLEPPGHTSAKPGSADDKPGITWEHVGAMVTSIRVLATTLKVLAKSLGTPTTTLGRLMICLRVPRITVQQSADTNILFGNISGAPGNHSYYLSFNDF